MRGLLVVGFCVLGLSLNGGALADDRLRVAILPVHVNSGSDGSYLRQGIADMLTARLGQREGIAVIAGKNWTGDVTEVELARSAGRELGADYVLFGSFTRFGEGASLDVMCLPVPGEGTDDARSIFVQSGTLGEIIPELDKLVDRVASYLSGDPNEAGDGKGPLDGVSRDALEELDRLKERVERLEDGFDAKERSGQGRELNVNDSGGSFEGGFDSIFEDVDPEVKDDSQVR